MAAARARFFSGLPADELTPMEHALRKALLKAIDTAGPFPLVEWIDRRIGGEVETRRNETGAYEIFLRGSNPPPVERKNGESKEAFLAALPGDTFAPAEEALRDAIFEFLATWRSPELATLQQMGDFPEVKRRQAAFLPRSVPLRDWIEHRIGAEIEFRPGAHGRPEVIHLTDAARQTVMAKLAQLQARGFAAPPMMPMPPPHVGFGLHAPPPPPAAVPAKEAKSAPDFFARLPADELLPGEVALRAGVLAFIERWPEARPATRPAGAPPLLADMAGDSDIKKARTDLLPRSVKLADWIERRIGGEVELKAAPNGQQEVYLRGAAPVAASATPEEKEEFFAALPEEEFSEEEELLRAALLDFLERSGTGPAPLSDAAADEAVADAKLFLPQGVFKEWIDRRIGGEIETRVDARGQAIFGKRGELGNAVKRRRV